MASALVLTLAGCQRQGPTFEDVPTTPNTPAPVTPVTPIAVAPRPSPTDLPEDPPAGGGAPSNPSGEGPTSTDPVARLDARIYFVECDGNVVPAGLDYVPLGCRIHLDVTPKDSHGRPTVAVGAPQWSYGNPGIISASSDPGDYTPTLTALAPGSLAVVCTLDGVQSNTVHITLK